MNISVILKIKKFFQPNFWCYWSQSKCSLGMRTTYKINTIKHIERRFIEDRRKNQNLWHWNIWSEGTEYIAAWKKYAQGADPLCLKTYRVFSNVTHVIRDQIISSSIVFIIVWNEGIVINFTIVTTFTKKRTTKAQCNYAIRGIWNLNLHPWRLMNNAQFNEHLNARWVLKRHKLFCHVK